jgi:predicted transcriptional regulator
MCSCLYFALGELVIVSSRVALLSVRPRFAAAILDGSKTVEVRRRRARIGDGAICLVYASSPVSALVGAIRVRTTDTDVPDALWTRWGDQTALERAEYDAYLAGSRRPCAIIVSEAVAFPQPVSLPELRSRREAFVAPQSYRFLDADELGAVLNGEALQVEHLANIALYTSSASCLPATAHVST